MLFVVTRRLRMAGLHSGDNRLEWSFEHCEISSSQWCRGVNLKILDRWPFHLSCCHNLFIFNWNLLLSAIVFMYILRPIVSVRRWFNVTPLGLRTNIGRAWLIISNLPWNFVVGHIGIALKVIYLNKRKLLYLPWKITCYAWTFIYVR